MHRAEIIDRLYDVALDPVRLEHLMDVWESRGGPGASTATGTAFDDREFDAHLHRASVYLDRFEAIREDGGYRQILDDISRSAAFVSDGGPLIVGFNRPAAEAFGLREGARLADLPFDPEDIGVLREAIVRVASGREEKGITLRIGMLNRDSPAIVRVGALASGEARPLALVISTELVWPREFVATVQEAFGLTTAEVEIVRGLTLGQPVKEIADARGRSAETVRTQLRSILAKTETHSQSELVRVVLGLMDVMAQPVEAAPPAARPGALDPVVFHSIRDSGGRRLTWIEFGAAFGTPCVVFHTDYCLIRWPAQAEQAAQRLDIRVIVPVRAGYGHTMPHRLNEEPLAATSRDYLAIIDHLHLRKVAAMAMGSALRYALHLAEVRPDLILGILGVSCQLPLQNDAQFARLGKWQRFIEANARHAPRILPFVVKAAFAMTRRIGKEAFFVQANGNSPADMRILTRPDLREAVMVGTEVALSDTLSAHEAFTRDAVGAVQDWSGLIARAQLPIRLVQGDEDPTSPIETVREIARAFPNLSVRIVPDAGQLLFFTEWPLVLQELERFLQRR